MECMAVSGFVMLRIEGYTHQWLRAWGSLHGKWYSRYHMFQADPVKEVNELLPAHKTASHDITSRANGR